MLGNGMRARPFSSNPVAVESIVPASQPAGQNGLIGCDEAPYSERARSFRSTWQASVPTTANYRPPDDDNRTYH